MLKLMFVASFGNWKFDGDAEGTYQEQEFNDDNQVVGFETTEYAYALDGLYVGDMHKHLICIRFDIKAS